MGSPKNDAEARSDSLLGLKLDGRYEVTATLGEGGIGQVFVGRHLRLKRKVAIKVLHERFQGNSNPLARFEREAQALAALTHPNIITITDYGVEGDLPYIVMELVEGRDLMRVLFDGALEQRRAIAIMRQILSSLAYAHAKKIIHRDLKPANVILRVLPGEDDHVEVLDFGLAKFMNPSAPGATLTKSGVVVGTPAYMPPEQASGEVVDARADVYAAGLIFFEMLTGKRPYPIDDRIERFRRQLADDTPTLASMAEGKAFHPDLERFVQKALLRDVDARFADGGEMLAALDELEEELRAGRPSRAVPTAGKGARLPRALVTGLFGLFGFAVGLGFSLHFLSDAHEEEPVSSAAAPPTSPAPSFVVETPAPTAPAIPEELSAIDARVRDGRSLTKNQIATTQRYRAEHPDDAVPHLLLAQGYANQGWWKDALDRYQLAIAADREARHDPAMLEDLLEATGTNTHRARASSMVRAIYGAEARGAIQEALESEPPGRHRSALEALLNRIESD